MKLCITRLQALIFLSALLGAPFSLAASVAGIYVSKEYSGARIEVTQKASNKFQVIFTISGEEFETPSFQCGEVEISKMRGVFRTDKEGMSCEIDLKFSPRKLEVDDHECGLGFFQMMAGAGHYSKAAGKPRPIMKNCRQR